MGGALRSSRRTPYWLLVRDNSSGMEILITRLSGGRRALSVFSFEDEAQMFLCLKGVQDGWQARETSWGELLSMLYTTLKGVGHITLDPIPENSGLNLSELLSVSREDFMAHLDRGRSLGFLNPGGPSTSNNHHPFHRTG